MAAARSELADHCLELLAPLGGVRRKRMFGGWGFYLDELFFALIASDPAPGRPKTGPRPLGGPPQSGGGSSARRLYLKVDAQTRAAFEAAGCAPFVYDGKGKSVTMSYFTAPEQAMESAHEMLPWARLALEAALRARAAKAAPKNSRRPR